MRTCRNGRGQWALVNIVNVGTLPAYVSSVALTENLYWVRRWPLVRSVSFRARHRWWLRWLLGKPTTSSWNVPKNVELGRLDPGELQPVRRDIDDEQLERLLETRQWAVVDTALRQYVGRIDDHRSAEFRPHDPRDGANPRL